MAETAMRIANYNQVVDIITEKNLKPGDSKVLGNAAKLRGYEDLNQKIAQL